MQRRFGLAELCADFAAPTAARRWLVAPACAGRAQLTSAGVRVAEFAPAWTEQRRELPAGLAADAEVALVERPDSDDPLQGFLPWIDAAPRGLWQGLQVRTTGAAAFVAAPRVRWRGSALQVDAHWDGAPLVEMRVSVGGGTWTSRHEQAHATVFLPLPQPLPWCPERPDRRVAVEIELWSLGALSDRHTVMAWRRRLAARGERLLLDGVPLRVRGILHWGHYPGLAGPDPDPEALRAEIRGYRARGFNLLKCCLFVPPQRFLDVCDQEGMLVWMEYPVWAQPLRGPRLIAAFRELVAHDAGHPSVVVRTFSCENDHRDPATARAIAALVRAADPHALLADDSGWLGTPHVADFHDEHAYLHAAQWPAYLERTRRALDALPARPLLLGETMVVDGGRSALGRRCALGIRRAQIEALAVALPDAGYVICGARDVAAAPLGLQFQDGSWKDGAAEWAWQVRLARGETPRRPRDDRAAPQAGPLPPAPTDGGGFLTARSLLDPAPAGGTMLAALHAGAQVLHLPALRHGAWRVAENPFWSPEPVLRGPAGSEPLRTLIGERLYFDLFRGRHLGPPRGVESFAALAGACWVAVRDHHDLGGRPRLLPVVLAARVGAGRLLVSALDWETGAGERAHALLLQELTAANDLPSLELPPPPPALHLGGPWQLRGASVRGGAATARTGTMQENAGANAFQGWAEFSAEVVLPADWTGPAHLHAESMGDGWELFVDDERVHQHGNLHGTWDAGRDLPCDVDLSAHLRAGRPQQWRFRVKDHRGAGGLVGPLWLHAGPQPARVLY